MSVRAVHYSLVKITTLFGLGGNFELATPKGKVRFCVDSNKDDERIVVHRGRPGDYWRTQVPGAAVYSAYLRFTGICEDLVRRLCEWHTVSYNAFIAEYPMTFDAGVGPIAANVIADINAGDFVIPNALRADPEVSVPSTNTNINIDTDADVDATALVYKQ